MTSEDGPAAAHAMPSREPGGLAQSFAPSEPVGLAQSFGPSEPGGLARVFAALEAAGIDYCVTHGAEAFPALPGSDVDIVVARGTPPGAVEAAIGGACDGERIVPAGRAPGLVTLALRKPGEAPRIVHLDVARDCEAEGRIVMRGEAMLAGRRRVGGVFAPAPASDFRAYLARCVLKGRLDARRLSRLAGLWREDPAGCAEALAALFDAPLARQVRAAFEAGEPAGRLPPLALMQAQVRERTPPVGLSRRLSSALARLLRPARRLAAPKGLSVVMLGPDGAGKSSGIEALQAQLSDLFPVIEVRGFAPPLHRIARRGPVRTDTPHALPARSPLVSVLRAAYWLAHDNWGRLPVRLVKARGGLVLFDRHLIDVLVDPVRYRYGGPRAVLEALGPLTPAPDLVILLHAPGEVLHARKPELTLAETRRQVGAYLDLVRRLPNGHVVDASQPFAKVVQDLEAILICARAMR